MGWAGESHAMQYMWLVEKRSKVLQPPLSGGVGVDGDAATLTDMAEPPLLVPESDKAESAEVDRDEEAGDNDWEEEEKEADDDNDDAAPARLAVALDATAGESAE